MENKIINLTNRGTEGLEILRRLILVHSYIYYELNSNILSDKDYDFLSKKVVEFQKVLDKPDSMYYNVFIGFDGTTGFDLYGKLSNKEQSIISSISHNMLRLGGKKRV